MRVSLEFSHRYRHTAHKPSRPYTRKRSGINLQVISDPSPDDNRAARTQPIDNSSSNNKHTANMHNQPRQPHLTPRLADPDLVATQLEMVMLAVGVGLLVSILTFTICLGLFAVSRRRRRRRHHHHHSSPIPEDDLPPSSSSQSGPGPGPGLSSHLWNDALAPADLPLLPLPPQLQRHRFLSLLFSRGGGGGAENEKQKKNAEHQTSLLLDLACTAGLAAARALRRGLAELGRGVARHGRDISAAAAGPSPLALRPRSSALPREVDVEIGLGNGLGKASGVDDGGSGSGSGGGRAPECKTGREAVGRDDGMWGLGWELGRHSGGVVAAGSGPVPGLGEGRVRGRVARREMSEMECMV
ncbi:hypothetical protein VTK56DRAFT_4042 [Thermocarpiscus australiensis]